MKRILSVTKLLVILLPIIWVVYGVDWQDLINAFSQVPLWIIPLSFFILFFRAVLQSLRYRLLISPFTTDISAMDIIILDMKARYYSIVVPSSLGLDILRGTLLKEKITVDQMVSSSLFFRITGIIPLFILSLGGMILLSGEEQFRQFLLPLIVLISCATAVSLSLFSKRASTKLIQIGKLFLPHKVVSFLEKVLHSFQLYRQEKVLHIENFLLSLLSQVLIIVSSLLVLKAVTGLWYPKEIFTFIPVTEILALLIPIAPNGAGARETMYILLFEILGHSTEERALFIAISSILYLVSLAGCIPVFFEKFYTKNRIRVFDKNPVD